ncbi:thiamine pyrophosphate-binding protein [Dyella flava]|nr:thiamine pyrophosphate-binding protein [Dyella flava]
MVLEMLRAEHVTHIFGNPGTSEMPLLDALEAYHDIDYVLALHEGVAVGMADGYARASGRPSFVSLHIDTGLANGISLLADAADGGTPIVLSSANKDIRKLCEGRTDLPQMVSQFTKWSAEATHPEQIPGLMRRAFKEAKTAPTGPTYIGFAANALNEEASVEIIPSSPAFDRIAPDEQALERAAALLSTAVSPVILVGDRVGQSGACVEVVRVAELLGADVYATCLGRVNFPTGHPLFKGALGQLFPATRRMLSEADIVLAVGTNVFSGFFYFSGRALEGSTKLIHIDSAAQEVAKSESTEIGIVADPKTALAQLAARLTNALTPAQHKRAGSRLRSAREQRGARETSQHVPYDASQPMPARLMMRELARALPRGAMLVDDAISSSKDLHEAFEFGDPDGYQGRGGAAIGWGMGAALGIKLAKPEQVVVAVVGDGSAMMTIQALCTAAMARIAVVYVVCNNRSYRVLKQNMRVYKREILHVDRFDSRFIGMDLPPQCDIAAVARAMGVFAVTIRDAAALGPTLEMAISRNEAVLLDVVIDGSI